MRLYYAISNAAPQMPNSTCPGTYNVTPSFFDFLSEWICGGSFDNDKEKEKNRWKPISEQRGQSRMAAGLHTEIARAKEVWLDV